MDVLLLNSPRFNMIKITDWFVDLGEISSFPPIGLMYLAGYIREKSNHRVRLVDSVAEGKSYSDLETLFKEEPPDVLGLTAFTHTFYDILKTIKLAKAVNPKTIIVLGGPHIVMFWKETITHNEVDYMIEGDGEISLLQLLNALENGGDLSGIPGLIYREKEGIRRNKNELVKDLDSLPFPAFDLLDITKYYSTFGTKKTVGTICTSRGCPFRCTYCQVTEKKYRARSPENIADEMELYIQKGIDDFFFFDDMFNITRNRVISICKEILKRNFRVTWTFRGRVDQVNEEMLQIAKEAGCKYILFGIEDYKNENLKKIKKDITIEQADYAVKLAKKYNIRTSTNWIIGFPHHTSKKDVVNLLNVAKRINSDYAQFSMLQLMPLCELYDQCVKEGVLHKNTWSDFVKNPTSDFHVELYEKYLSSKELSELYKMCFQKYYIRPSYIIKSILQLKSFNEFKTKLKGFTSTFISQ